jgi:hypothetical protein
LRTPTFDLSLPPGSPVVNELDAFASGGWWTTAIVKSGADFAAVSSIYAGGATADRCTAALHASKKLAGVHSELRAPDIRPARKGDSITATDSGPTELASGTCVTA